MVQYTYLFIYLKDTVLKSIPSKNPCQPTTSECDFIWKKGLCRNSQDEALLDRVANYLCLFFLLFFHEERQRERERQASSQGLHIMTHPSQASASQDHKHMHTCPACCTERPRGVNWGTSHVVSALWSTALPLCCCGWPHDLCPLKKIIHLPRDTHREKVMWNMATRQRLAWNAQMLRSTKDFWHKLERGKEGPSLRALVLSF